MFCLVLSSRLLRIAHKIDQNIQNHFDKYNLLKNFRPNHSVIKTSIICRHRLDISTKTTVFLVVITNRRRRRRPNFHSPFSSQPGQ